MSPNSGSDAERRRPSGCHRQRQRLQQLEKSGGFQVITTLVILLNIFVLYAEADQLWLDSEGYAKVQLGFQTFFTLEIGFRTLAYGVDFFCSQQCRRKSTTTMEELFWNWFDFLIVFFGLFQEVAAALTRTASVANGMVNILRMFRVLRVMRAVRVLKVCPELYILLQGLAQSMRMVLWVAVMFFVLLVTCASLVCKTIGKKADQFSDPELIRHDFGTVRASMRTLFIFLTFDDWSSTARVVNERYPWFEVFWCSYLFLGSFTLLSVLTGLMADAMAKAKDDHDAIITEHQAKQLDTLDDVIRRLFRSADFTGDLQVDLEEFKMMMAAPETKELLDECNIAFNEDEAETLYFALFGTKGAVPFKDFTEGMVLLSKSKSKARVKDMMLLEGQVFKLDTYLLGSAAQAQEDKVDALHARSAMLWERARHLERRLQAVFAVAGYVPG